MASLFKDVSSPGSRRGTRIPCNIPVTLTTVNATHWFSERGTAILANPYGCAVRSCRAVEVGTAVLIDGLPGEKMAAAQVVNCICIGEYEKLWLLGLELHKPGNVWGIEAPPDDWRAALTTRK